VRVGELIVIASHSGAPRAQNNTAVGVRWDAADAVLIEDQP